MSTRTRLIGILAWATVTGCAATSGSNGNRADESVSVAAVEDRPVDLDKEYLIGPTAAGKLGLRIEYQARTYPGSAGVKELDIQGDSIFVLDGRNFLTRLMRKDGRTVWRIPVADPVTEIQGVTYIPQIERIFLTATGDLIVIDDATGSQIARQKLDQVASTRPVVYGAFLIYGSRSGQIVWHSYPVGYQWRAYRIAPSINLPPILADGYVLGVGTDARVMVLDAESATGVWDKRLLSSVVAAPTAGNGLAYVAGLDQYVWALDLGSGRTAWRYLCESPLRTSPMLIGDHLYQYIPTEGLLCFEANPQGSPGGVVIWTLPEVTGDVVGRRDHHLFVWDDEARRMTIVDDDRGSVITAVDLPAVRHFRMPGSDGTVFYAAGDDGRVIRLSPRT